MASYSVATTKDKLSALIEKAIGGEEVVITKRGKATAKLVAADGRKLRDRKSATDLLRRRMANVPAHNIPVERFSDWMYEDRDD